MQVTVEILGIAAVSNDSVAVPGFFIKPQRHGVHPWQIFKLARMHQPGCFRPQYPNALKFSLLQVGNHEARNVSGRY